jgi:hypothetical protein
MRHDPMLGFGDGGTGFSKSFDYPWIDFPRKVRDICEELIWKAICAPVPADLTPLAYHRPDPQRTKRIQTVLVKAGAKRKAAEAAAPLCEYVGSVLSEYRDESLDQARDAARRRGAAGAAAFRAFIETMGKSAADVPPLSRGRVSIGALLLDCFFAAEKRTPGRPARKILKAAHKALSRQWTEATGRKAGVSRAGYTGKLTAFGHFLYVCVSDSDVDSDDSVSKFIKDLSRL